jgi:hypothetical protein
MSYFRSINQQIQVATVDASNLVVNQTFTGTAYSTLGVNAIQTNLKADQNCVIYVDQGPADGTWNISDAFNYYNGTGGTGFTTQATDAYTRIRVKNVGTAATTVKDLSMVLCPIVEALPRALSAEGNLKVGVYEIEGQFGKRVLADSNNSLKVATSTRLIGASFQGDTTDTNFWTFVGTGSGAGSQTGGTLTLATGATASSTISVQSTRTARYAAGNPNYYRAQVTVPVQGGACIRGWGAYSATDGYFYQYDGTNLACMSRKASVDSTVASGSFNGYYGVAYTMGTTCDTYEIHYNNRSAYFVVNEEILHTLTGSSATTSGTLSLPVRAEVKNGTGNTSNNTLAIRTAAILRLGNLVTQPTHKRYAATTTGDVLKHGVGNLHGVFIGSVAASGSVITLYDGISTGGTVMAAWTITYPGGGNYNPVTYDFKGIPFYTGLFIVIATQSASVTVFYE